MTKSLCIHNTLKLAVTMEGDHSKWNAEQVISVTQENNFDPGSDFTGGSQTVRYLLTTTDLFQLKYSPVFWQHV